MPQRATSDDAKRIRRLYRKVEKAPNDQRFENISRLLEAVGFECRAGRGGSHNVFRKKGALPISIPKAIPINKRYVFGALAIVMELCNDRFGLGWMNDDDED